jgi:hypothetical protein
MTIRQSEAHTFIIRIRRPTARGATEAEEWHGEVVHVPSQRSASFRGLRNVETVLVRLIAAGEPD